MSRIDRKYLRNSINSLCEFLDIEYNINSGGCCWIAAEIAKHLDNLKIPYDLVVYDFDDKEVDAINNEVQQMFRNRKQSRSVTGPHTCNHYCLYLKGFGIINSTGDEESRRFIITNVTHTNINWIYKKGSWNDAYNSDNNKVIRKIINLFFRRYEKIFEEERLSSL